MSLNISNKDRMIEKVRKLLSVADPTRNTFEAEMENAMRLAKNLMAKYQIEMFEVDTNNGEKEIVYDFITVDSCTMNAAGWELFLAPVVDNLCCTKSFRKRGTSKSTIVFCGTAQESAIASDMYRILNSIIKERAKNYSNPSVDHTAYRSYAEGIVNTLYKRSKDEVVLDSYDQEKKYALVVIDKKNKVEEWMNKEFKLNPAKTKKHHVDYVAYAQGRIDGNSISLRTRGLVK